jgi:hypothetical protein
LVYDEIDGEQHAARGGAHANDTGRKLTFQGSAEVSQHTANHGSIPARHVTTNCEAEPHDRRHYRSYALPAHRNGREGRKIGCRWRRRWRRR